MYKVSHFSHVQLFAILWTIAHQASFHGILQARILEWVAIHLLLQVIFQTQEHWLLLKVEVKVARSCLTLCDPMSYAVYGILQARILEWVAFPSPGDLPNPGIKPRSPAMQVDSLPAEPPGKPDSCYLAPILLSLFQPGILLICW